MLLAVSKFIARIYTYIHIHKRIYTYTQTIYMTSIFHKKKKKVQLYHAASATWRWTGVRKVQISAHVTWKGSMHVHPKEGGVSPPTRVVSSRGLHASTWLLSLLFLRARPILCVGGCGSRAPPGGGGGGPCRHRVAR